MSNVFALMFLEGLRGYTVRKIHTVRKIRTVRMRSVKLMTVRKKEFTARKLHTLSTLRIFPCFALMFFERVEFLGLARYVK